MALSLLGYFTYIIQTTSDQINKNEKIRRENCEKMDPAQCPEFSPNYDCVRMENKCVYRRTEDNTITTYAFFLAFFLVLLLALGYAICYYSHKRMSLLIRRAILRINNNRLRNTRSIYGNNVESYHNTNNTNNRNNTVNVINFENEFWNDNINNCYIEEVCSICLVETPNIMIYDCMHVCMCRDCLDNYNVMMNRNISTGIETTHICPLCRKNIQNYVMVPNDIDYNNINNDTNINNYINENLSISSDTICVTDYFTVNSESNSFDDMSMNSYETISISP